MQRLVAAVVVAVRVDLDHQRETLHALLRGEVSAQTVDRDEDLQGTSRMEGEVGITIGNNCFFPQLFSLEECFHFLCTIKHTKTCATTQNADRCK